MFELKMQRTFNTSVEKLFAAWCEAETIKKWFGPGSMQVPEASADVTIGGKYRIVLEDPDDGSQHILGGEYREIKLNEALVFTWAWEGSPNTTEVTLGFKALDDGKSELTVHHTEFVDQDACDKHEMGWNGCFVKLAAFTS